MARENFPLNAAFPNDKPLPNIVGNGFSWVSNFATGRDPIYVVHGLDSQALVINLDQELDKKIERIFVSCLYDQLNGLTQVAPQRLGARLFIFRNVRGNLNTDIVDPVLTDKTQLLDTAAGAQAGINWGHMLDWGQEDILHDFWIAQEGTTNILIDRTFKASDKISIVLTPFYGPAGLQWQANSSVNPIQNPGNYIGTFSTNTFEWRVARVLRSLTVSGDYCA